MTDTLAEPELELEVETRSGDGFQVAEVNFPKRIVTVIAMPYERPTPIDGRFLEIVSRGAFDGIEKRTSKVRANRDHSWDKPVGRVIGLHPSRKEGLVADVKVSPTVLGNETLSLCDDDVLSASVGFGLLRRDDGRVWDDAEVWENNRSVRRLNRLWLDHLAFVPNPAYADAAVISVRNAPASAQEAAGHEHTSVSTPNRDTLLLQQLKAQHDELNRRWLR
jgi:HK97 family phage prohead protease